ncbi:MAG: hypothetical protein IJT18_01245 [Oscillospiraceae bacterium]|nr:hypothetical protein [Oscillospiraceae bacterium]
MWNNNSSESTRITTRMFLRIAAGGYLAYLGYKIVSLIGTEEAGMPPWLAYLSGIVFMAAGVGFAIYSLITMRKQAQKAAADEIAAQLPPEEDETEPQELPEQTETTEE